MQSIYLSDFQRISSLEPLRGLRKLNNLYISAVNTVDLSIFVGLPELRSISLVAIENMDYSILTQFNLDYLSTDCNDDIFQVVKLLSSLKDLTLFDRNTPGSLTDISGIEQLHNLIRLCLYTLNVYDISPLTSMQIEELAINLPDDIDLTPLLSLPNLTRVHVGWIHTTPADGDSVLLVRVREILSNVEVFSDFWRFYYEPHN